MGTVMMAIVGWFGVSIATAAFMARVMAFSKRKDLPEDALSRSPMQPARLILANRIASARSEKIRA